MNRVERKPIFLLLVLLTASAAQAQPFRIGGFVDGYSAWNGNSPDGHENFVPGTGTTAKRANEFALNLAELEISRDTAPLGFKVSFVAGNGTDVIHAGEPQDTYRHIYDLIFIALTLVLLLASVAYTRACEKL